MATSAMAKFALLDSQSDGTTAHYPTPSSEALDHEVMEPPPPMDFAAVAKILAPITEELNDQAEEAMYPSPPINTPLSSPTPSVNVRLAWQGRGRGFSAIGDRLVQLKIEDRKTFHRHHHQRGTDVTSSCCRSVEASVAEEVDEGDVASISEVMSEGCKDKDCPGYECSPGVNPRIEEYLSFTSKDLPTQAPPPATGTTLAEHASSTSATALDVNSLRSRGSHKSDGVTEKSNWAEELEDLLDRCCLRLEQLADDEHVSDPTKSVEEYYVARLRRLLGANTRKVPVKIVKANK
ncbi:hypothetical protein EK21DRAFT_72270 [Setomelanomma holmii]|uniref:Uncharacterized protein n=1 Tax=Setomelanomma holmii TaxID=210430 RepID=A0A9P4H2U6_9PLEO|nr:hypothetical protein EK21DRAFT_72270 [Setomelanomma holmii]